MKQETRKLLEKAEGAIDAGAMLLKTEHVEAAAGRFYYAMFYVAEALLAEKDLRFRKHGGVHAAFGEGFVKTGRLDAKYHRWLLDAFDRRIQADYGVDADLTDKEVEEMAKHARAFLDEARKQLERQS